MIGLNDTIAPAAAAVPVLAGVTPRGGIWARLRQDCDWRAVFLTGWVPVKTLVIESVEDKQGNKHFAWRVDPSRVASANREKLAAILSNRGPWTHAEVLKAFDQGEGIGIGPCLVEYTHDFDAHLTYRGAWPRCCVGKDPASER